MSDTILSAPEGNVFDRLRAAVHPDGSADMMKARREIMAEHERATTTAQYVIVLKLHKWFEESGARAEGPPDVIADFLKACGQQYAWFLTSECLARSKHVSLAAGRTFDDQVCPSIYEEIVRREVAAGRMSTDNPMYKVILETETAAAVPQPVIKKRNLFARMFA